MDPHSHSSHQNPHFHALDIILGYLNRGNTAHEIKYLSSVANAWCQQYPLFDYTPESLDEVLWTHPHLFDLSILSFARLYSFNDRGRRNWGQNIRLGHSEATFPALSHIRPLVTAQQFFFAIIDAYTLYVGGTGRWFHDRIVAQDLKVSPIMHYIPEIIHCIAALNVRQLLTSEFSTFSPKTSLGFSCYLAKGVDIMMMDAPPINDIENDCLAELMDVDNDAGQEIPAPQNGLSDGTRVGTNSSRQTSAPRGIKRWRSCRSRRRQSWSVRKKRKKRH